MKTIVLKFGGASLATWENFARVADIIIARSRGYDRTAVVVSAMGTMTDNLIALAEKVHPNPPRREYDMLVTVGERISVALLSMALSAKGYDAVSFTGSQAGIITTDDHSNAKIIDVRPQRLTAPFDSKKIVIIAGFQGMSVTKEITTLGRGGSDTTAVALGSALQATKIEFFKDVEGIYDKDPKQYSDAEIIRSLSYEHAITISQASSREVLHSRCLALAKKNNIPLHVLPFESILFHDTPGTMIDSGNNERPVSPLYEND